MRNSSLDMNNEDNPTNSHRLLISVMSILLVIIEVSGILCNSVILIIYYKYTRLRTATNLFILNLALCNLLLAVLDIILSAPSSFNREWQYGDDGCTAYGFGYLYLMAVAVSTLAVIAFDRFCVITKPVRNLRPFVLTKKHSRGLIFLVHIYTFIFTVPPLFSWNTLVPDTNFHTGCYINYADNDVSSLTYTIIFTISTCILPFVLTTCCYAKIYRSVRNSSKRSTINNTGVKQKTIPRGESVPSLAKLKKRSSTHARTARMIALVMFFFLLTWLPGTVTGMCQAFGARVPPLVMYFSVFLEKSCVMYNAVVYVFLNHRFRAAFLHLTFLCRDDSRLHMATSMTNHSGRFGDIGVSVSEHNTNKTRISKKISQLSIIGPLDGSSPSVKTSHGDVSKVLNELDRGKIIGYYPEERSAIGDSSGTHGQFLGLATTRIVASYACVAGVLEEEQSENTSGSQKISISEEQTATRVPQDAVNIGRDHHQLSDGSSASQLNHGAFYEDNNIVLDDERKINEQFQELSVNSLNNIGFV